MSARARPRPRPRRRQPARTVGDAMHAGVVTCRPETTLRTVAGMLAGHHIHAVVVADGDEPPGRPCAVVTDRDVVRAAARDRLDGTSAREAATESIVTVRADLDLRLAAELMAGHATMHLVVVSPGTGRPVGVLSGLDVAEAYAP